MKIFHISDHLPGYHKIWGGAEQVAYRYLNLLNTENIEVIIGGVKPTKEVNEDFRFIRVRVLEDYFPEKYQVYFTGLKNRILSFDPISFIHLLFIFQKEKPNIVHFHKFNMISFSGILAAKLSGIKIVLGIYDYWYLCPGGMLIDQKRNLCRKYHGTWCKNCDAVKDFRFLLPIISPFRKPIFNFFFNQIDIFTVLSNSLGKMLEEYGIPKSKIYLLRQVFQLDNSKFLNRKPGSHGNLVVYIGWLDPRKGPDIAILAFKEIVNKIPDAKLVMIGEALDKTYEKHIVSLIKNQNLQNKIKLLGKLPHEEVLSYYQAAKVILLPEQWENMSPVVLVEAMLYGKAVVASNIGGLSEFIDDGKSGFLVERSNPNNFAEIAILVLQNSLLANKIGNEAKRKILSVCNNGETKKRLLSLYRKLINEKN